MEMWIIIALLAFIIACGIMLWIAWDQVRMDQEIEDLYALLGELEDRLGTRPGRPEGTSRGSHAQV